MRWVFVTGGERAQELPVPIWRGERSALLYNLRVLCAEIFHLGYPPADYQVAKGPGLRNAMQHDLQDTISLLSRTPTALSALLLDLPEMWTQRNEGKNTWCASEVVAHLIYGECTDWIPRTKILLQFGESKAFEAFNRAGHVRESQGKSLAQLLDEFARLRTESLAELRALNLRAEDLTRRGRHPAFGPVTLSQLLAAWVGHDLTHLHQISRVMAHQYREAVGPFAAYLGVLHCAGHSAPP